MHKHEGPQWKTFWRRFCPLADTVGVEHWGQFPQISFVPLKMLLCLENKNLSPLNMYFAPQTLKPGYRPDSAKIVFAIKVFCFEGHSASRCSITSKTFFINHH